MEEKNEESEESSEEIDDSTNWKARALELQEKAIEQRERSKKLKERLEELETKIAKLDSKTADPKEEKKDQDIGQLAFLEVRGITNQDDIAWLEKEAKETGKSINQLLGFKYIQEYLKESADNRTSATATDIETSRGGQFAKKDADYWYSRYISGKSPFKEIPKEFQREVVAKRESSESKGRKYYNG